MKQGVPAFNVFLSLVYLATAGLLLYLLKRKTHNSNRLQLKNLPSEHISYKLMAFSWFKKYSLFCILARADLKYLLKEALIIGAYAATCFNINQITLWPVTFALFMVPIIMVIFEVLLRAVKNKVKEYVSEPKIENEIIAAVNKNES